MDNKVVIGGQMRKMRKSGPPVAIDRQTATAFCLLDGLYDSIYAGGRVVLSFLNDVNCLDCGSLRVLVGTG